jgi:hypothetical protein
MTTAATAADLRPGDVIVNGITGQREHAAFDVEVREHVVLVWTAVRDQEAGVPEVVTYEATASLMIAQR